MTESYKNVVFAALFVVGLIGYIFAEFAPAAAAQSPTGMMGDMMNMTNILSDKSLPFKMGELETPDIPIKCIVVGDVIKSVLGNVTTVDELIASASNVLANATDDTETRQAMTEMLNEQKQNVTDQDLQDIMNFVQCEPVIDENTTQSMKGGSMID